ncbi:sodium:proton antiporter NhaD [Candidatus Thiodictyon syntrophicum]|jgi:NhaD family Na+/H+ antiporter|uniref:Sodium:proton antiporter n=1 Tax=Candidatus Thiodictyon syntrophicum TaxID=1166950 RepID=A0A2K8U9M0_9GAMM|nr:sodium:proton antiporter NhaD [Candidatus Thiodictyon syntrophicum]AUB82263.1 sodium:proton antiporter [Candidatus Thiodictyon syntrophicum]
MPKVPSAWLGAFALLSLSPATALAGDAAPALDLTAHPVGLAALLIFILAYVAVMAEEFLHLRKSKPVVLAAGLIWAMLAYVSAQQGAPLAAEQAVRHALLDVAGLILFLLVAMTYINALAERQVFEALRAWLIRLGVGFRALFWMTGALAFIISPIADNLTTALLMCAVVMAVGAGNRAFVILACINIVVAANAGGAFSPFGDITTLMVWQKGIIDFFGFFVLFVPALVNWLIPAALMHFAVPDLKPAAESVAVPMKRGARRILALFLLTIATAVGFHQFLHLPPVIGMLTGLGYLQFFGYYLRMTHGRWQHRNGDRATVVGDMTPFDVFNPVARAEWDTLLFFYGVVMCVAGLGYVGYLSLASEVMYLQWGPTAANIGVGLVSAVVDNIPVMFAVLSMNPQMDQTQWLLVTLTAGVGGSLLSIGSAAGVGLMGQARGIYTFFGHLKWTPAIALGYFASIWVHLLING